MSQLPTHIYTIVNYLATAAFSLYSVMIYPLAGSRAGANHGRQSVPAWPDTADQREHGREWAAFGTLTSIAAGRKEEEKTCHALVTDREGRTADVSGIRTDVSHEEATRALAK